MAKYTYRFHCRCWVDITVDASDELEASQIALDKYNNGDFVQDFEDFENVSTKLIKSE